MVKFNISGTYSVREFIPVASISSCLLMRAMLTRPNDDNTVNMTVKDARTFNEMEIGSFMTPQPDIKLKI